MKLISIMIIALLLGAGIGSAQNYMPEFTMEPDANINMGGNSIRDTGQSYAYDAILYISGSNFISDWYNGTQISSNTLSSVTAQAAITALNASGGGNLLVVDYILLDASINKPMDVSITGVNVESSGFYGSCDPLIEITPVWLDGDGNFLSNTQLRSMKLVQTGIGDIVHMVNLHEEPYGLNIYDVDFKIDNASSTGAAFDAIGWRHSEMSGCRFFGDGAGTGVYLWGNSSIGCMGDAISGQFWNLGTGVDIFSDYPLYTAGIRIVNAGTLANGIGINATGVNSITITSSMIDNDDEPIRIYECYPVTITNNYIGALGEDEECILFDSTLNYTIPNKNIVVTNNYFTSYASSEGIGIHVNKSAANGASPTVISINNNIFDELGPSAIKIYRDATGWVAYVLILGNDIQLCDNGIELDGSAYTRINDNMFAGISGSAVVNTRSYDATWEDNFGLADGP